MTMKNGEYVVISKDGYFDIVIKRDNDGDYWMIQPEGWFHWSKIDDIPEEKILAQIDEMRNDDMDPHKLIRDHRPKSYSLTDSEIQRLGL